MQNYNIEIKAILEKIEWDFSNSKNAPIHSIHSYPAKFIPEIPRAIIDNLPIQKNTIILDPFCGSGVTLLEAQNQGFESIGIDLNPIACLISTVKTQPLPPDFLLIAKKIADSAQKTKENKSIPNIPNLDHWFKVEIQQALSNLIHEINLLDNELIQNALKFCFSSIIVKVSNQESDTRYASVDKKQTPETVFHSFISSCEKLQKHKITLKQGVKSRIINKSCLELNENDFSKPVGLVVTSPPYPNAYEYWLYHKYRMWWLGFDPLYVKQNEIGARAHYFKKNHQTINDFMSQMRSLLISINKVSIPGAFMCFVIGRSKIHGNIYKNDEIISEIAKEIGFNHITTLTREIKSGRKSFNLSHARIKEEYIVILQK